MGEAKILGFLPKSMAFRGVFTAKWCEKGPGKYIFFSESGRFFFSSDLDRSRCADHDGLVRFEKFAKPDFWGAKK